MNFAIRSSNTGNGTDPRENHVVEFPLVERGAQLRFRFPAVPPDL